MLQAKTVFDRDLLCKAGQRLRRIEDDGLLADLASWIDHLLLDQTPAHARPGEGRNSREFVREAFRKCLDEAGLKV